MKQFAAKRTLEEVKASMITKGFTVDDYGLLMGGDWIFFRTGKLGDMTVDVGFNVCSGRFCVWQKKKLIASESSANLDNEAWYAGLLDTLYCPKEVIAL